jgi:two-component SAPR family response regulator
VDSLVLENLFGKIGKSPADQVEKLCEKAVSLYEGPLLPSDSDLQWVTPRREMMKNSLLRIIGVAGGHCEQTGQWKKAVEYYLKGLDADNLAEEFYQRLMVCHQRLGNNANAVKTYNRCRALLQEHLGIEPSAKTQAIYSSIVKTQ